MEHKVIEWYKFAIEVMKHINNYVIPQYGDYPDKMIEDWDIKSIKEQLNRYVKRIGVGSRGLKEELRDALKIAHYACYLYTKLKK